MRHKIRCNGESEFFYKNGGLQIVRVTCRGHPCLKQKKLQSGPCLVRKNFQDSLSNRIFGCMHGALNIDKNKN